jgi:hypothetical protein
MQMVRQLEFALFDFRLHAEYDPANGGRIYEILEAGAGSRWRCSARRSSTGCPTASPTSSPAATRRATTATSGPRCSPPTPSRCSRRSGVFDPDTGRAFLTNILEKGGSTDGDGAVRRLPRPRAAQVEVDPYLEVTEVCDRTLRAGGPALLFERPKGSDIPLLGNLFGTPRRVALGMGQDSVEALREVGRVLAQLKEPEPPRGFMKDALDSRCRSSRKFSTWPPRSGATPCQEVVLEAVRPSTWASAAHPAPAGRAMPHV